MVTQSLSDDQPVIGGAAVRALLDQQRKLKRRVDAEQIARQYNIPASVAHLQADYNKPVCANHRELNRLSPFKSPPREPRIVEEAPRGDQRPQVGASQMYEAYLLDRGRGAELQHRTIDSTVRSTVRSTGWTSEQGSPSDSMHAGSPSGSLSGTPSPEPHNACINSEQLQHDDNNNSEQLQHHPLQQSSRVTDTAASNIPESLIDATLYMSPNTQRRSWQQIYAGAAADVVAEAAADYGYTAPDVLRQFGESVEQLAAEEDVLAEASGAVGECAFCYWAGCVPFVQIKLAADLFLKVNATSGCSVWWVKQQLLRLYGIQPKDLRLSFDDQVLEEGCWLLSQCGIECQGELIDAI